MNGCAIFAKPAAPGSCARMKEALSSARQAAAQIGWKLRGKGISRRVEATPCLKWLFRPAVAIAAIFEHLLRLWRWRFSAHDTIKMHFVRSERIGQRFCADWDVALLADHLGLGLAC